MPIYEYTCMRCEHEFEELVRTTAEGARPTCPQCRSDEIQRRLSVFAARQQGGSNAAGEAGPGCRRCGDPYGPCAN